MLMSKKMRISLFLCAVWVLQIVSTPCLVADTDQSNTHTNELSGPDVELESEDTLPVPYDVSEFPDFALQIRRAETIFIGSLPVTYAAASLADKLIYQESGFPSQAAYTRRIIYCLSLSFVITVLDLLIDIQGRP